MKVILATTQFMPELGGVPRLLWKLCVHKPDTIDLSVLSVCQQSPEKYADFDQSTTVHIERVEPVAGNGLTSVSYFFHLLKMVKTLKPDIILCGVGFPTAIIAAFIELVTGVPYAVYTHSEDLTIQNGIKRALLGWALNRALGIYVLGDFGKKQLVRLGVKKPLVMVAPPGIDPEPFLSPGEITLPAGTKKGIVLLTVARLVRRKGQDMVIKALPIIRSKIPDITYVVVGRGPDEPELRSMVSDLNLEDCVQFAGGISDDQLPTYYQNCNIFVMPTRPSDDESEVEGFGIVYLEAGASGKPVIGGKSGGVEGAIIDGVTGYLIDPLSVDELVQRITQLAEDPQLAHKMGSTGRERVLSDFTAKIFGDKVFQGLTAALQTRR